MTLSRFIFLVIVFVLTGCDPASMSRRVKPDKTVMDGKVSLDIYLSKDGKVEFQVYQSRSIGIDAPGLKAIIVNNRSTAIEAHLGSATYQPSWSDKPLPAKGNGYVIEIPAGKSAEVSWTSGAEGIFRLPIEGADKSTDMITAVFERCNPFWGKCETKR